MGLVCRNHVAARIVRDADHGGDFAVVRLDLAPCTLVAAITRAGAIPYPLREHFGILLRFRYYLPEALAEIVEHGAARLEFAADTDAAVALG
ncbi:MAG: hypothetical protein OXI33_11795 [Chloroflexota bacterium]|nr:hypothetical protein [Chloroflexota bacterium]